MSSNKFAALNTREFKKDWAFYYAESTPAKQ